MLLSERYTSTLIVAWAVMVCVAQAKAYPHIAFLKQTIDVSDVSSANVEVDIRSTTGQALYKLRCHAVGFAGESDFDYSGDFECRLNSIDHPDKYSTLLTENSGQSRDWESRGRFFGADLRNSCANIPQFGAQRSFELRGMNLILQITEPTFIDGKKLHSLKLTVKVIPNLNARRAIAKIVPLPKVGIPSDCRLSEYFVDPSTFKNGH